MSERSATSRQRMGAGWRIGLAAGLALLPGAILADQSLLAALGPEALPWLAALMRWATWLGYGPVDIGIPLAVGLLGQWEGRAGSLRRGLLGAAAVTVAGLLDQVVKNLTCRARPGVPGAGVFLTDFPCFPAAYEAASFPSGHASTAFALATVLSLWYPRWTGGFLVLAAGIGWSRVILGSHFPSDVLGGALLGCLTVMGFSRWAPGLSASVGAAGVDLGSFDA